MEITVTQFKAKCLGIIERVQREKCRVIISRHGRPAAELRPILSVQASRIFGSASKETKIIGDLLSTGDSWDAEN